MSAFKAYEQFTEYGLRSPANGLIGMTGRDPERMREMAAHYGLKLVHRDVTASEWADVE
ncbi:hypothetical protein [Nonomuraea sp. B19D2]|uniref:hypothetical protein n=1 Tax=Nonomuraea sp. B19D2 TaxID=3159561 RepID=UPI0032DA7CA3